MNKNQLNETFEAITPTDMQKKRMLENILAKTNKKDTSKVILLERHKVKPFLAIAASLMIVASGIIGINGLNDMSMSNNPAMPSTPQGTENFVVYQDREYRYLQELTDIEKEDLVGPLAEIENVGDSPDIIWEMKGYDPLFIIILEHLGTYYLCESVVNETP